MIQKPPTVRSFDVRELAFFWNPRRWPAIVARFGEQRSGSSDIRDAIIVVDDEGGLGFLRWHAAIASWCLTDKGKNWVKNFLGPRILARERDWQPPADVEIAVAKEIAARSYEDDEKKADEAPPPAAPETKAETADDELARLAAEQEADR